jgi:hypothetical protein
MQEARSNEQSSLKLYYVSKDYIVQDGTIGPILYKRNGGGSPEQVEIILKMCGMRIKSKESEHKYNLEVQRDA